MNSFGCLLTMPWGRANREAHCRCVSVLKLVPHARQSLKYLRLSWFIIRVLDSEKA
jgi:hypothetical protein